jgi:hypothetical protein
VLALAALGAASSLGRGRLRLKIFLRTMAVGLCGRASDTLRNVILCTTRTRHKNTEERRRNETRSQTRQEQPKCHMTPFQSVRVFFDT